MPTEFGEVPPGAAGRAGRGSAGPAPVEEAMGRDDGRSALKIVVAGDGGVGDAGDTTRRCVGAVAGATAPDRTIAGATGAASDLLMVPEAPSASVRCEDCAP